MKVSIILISWSPTENRMKLLANTLSSLKKFTGVPYELIVVDNGPEFQTDFLKKQKIDKHIINETNKGIGFARNQGFEVATGEYVCFCDNDVLFRKDWLKDAIEIFEKYPDEKLIVNSIFSSKAIRRYRRLHLGMLGDYPIWQRSGGTCLVMKRTTVEEIGKWSLGSTPGRDYSKRVRLKGYKFVGTVETKVLHKGYKKTYDWRKKLIGGEWVSHGSEYWNGRWSGNFPVRYVKGHKRLFDGIRPHLKGRIIDLGCGATGLYVGGNYDVTGIDFSFKAIEASKKLYPQGKFIVGRLEKVSLPSNRYDTVVLSEIIEHYGDFSKILLRAKRICKVGGHVIITVPKKHFDKDHVHPVWSKQKIYEEVASVIGNVEVSSIKGKWWLVDYEKT